MALSLKEYNAAQAAVLILDKLGSNHKNFGVFVDWGKGHIALVGEETADFSRRLRTQPKAFMGVYDAVGVNYKALIEDLKEMGVRE